MEHKKLQDYFSKAMTSGDFKPTIMPPTPLLAPVKRVVRKASH